MSGRSARVVAQAKINLFLRILAREASGYHQLETLFCRLALGDTVTVRTTERGRSLDVAGEAMPPGGLGPVEQNLAWRAAAAYVAAAGWPGGFAIEIDKRIPVGGGLGGGSADAGAVLRALEALSAAPIGTRRLLAIAESLGADVPFLTQDRSPLALAWGRGERMLALPALEARRCLLAVMSFSVPTAEAYSWLSDMRATTRGTATAALIEPSELSNWEGVLALAANDFEAVVPAKFPRIRAMLDFMRSAHMDEIPVFDLGLLSGSGGTVAALPKRHDDPELYISLEQPTDGDVRFLMTDTASRVEPVVVSD